MIVLIVLLVTSVKFLFIPLYHSTDFEVHRNWLALTYNLNIDRWYYENTSEWTLDYPPFFAWLEHCLSHVAQFFDPKMVNIRYLNYESQPTILFQRLSVILLDIVYISGVYRCTTLLDKGKLLTFIILVSNAGLLMVDHIHFQYNGFLYGILMISISYVIKNECIKAAFWFAVLLNFKHIYLYIAPVYIVYLFRAYCFTVPSKDGVHTAWYSFSLGNLCKLAAVVIFVFGVSFGPFMKHLPQIFSRLFPFKRGLCHAYWAPNFWAFYNIVDKALQHVLPRFDIPVSKIEASMTGGLVQEFDHAVLPTIRPSVTLLLTVLSMMPALVQMWNLCADRKYRAVNFVRCILICATCSFMFGWHVHEKAILLMLIPLSFLSALGDVDGRMFLFLSTVGHYSLFPLLYPKNLLYIKVFMLLTHCSIGFSYIPSLYEKFPKSKSKKRSVLRLPMLNILETFYLYGLVLLCLYENIVHKALGLDRTLPFLPLMLTSVYCAIGVFYFWIVYYHYFLTFGLSPPPVVTTGTAKKVK